MTKAIWRKLFIFAVCDIKLSNGYKHQYSYTADIKDIYSKIA